MRSFSSPQLNCSQSLIKPEQATHGKPVMVKKVHDVLRNSCYAHMQADNSRDHNTWLYAVYGLKASNDFVHHIAMNASLAEALCQSKDAAYKSPLSPMMIPWLRELLERFPTNLIPVYKSRPSIYLTNTYTDVFYQAVDSFNLSDSRRFDYKAVAAKIFALLNSKDIKLKIALAQLDETRQYNGMCKYIDKLLSVYPTLSVMQLDLAYDPMYHDEINDLRNAKDMKRLLNNMRHHNHFKAVRGHIWVSGFGLASGHYTHCIFFFDQMDATGLAEVEDHLKTYWVKQITMNKGCTPSCKHPSQWAKRLAVGTLSADDADKIKDLKSSIKLFIHIAQHMRHPSTFKRKKFGKARVPKPLTSTALIPLQNCITI